MNFDYNGSCQQAVDGDQRKLAQRLREAVAAFLDDPRFCVPAAACQALDSMGGDTPVVVLGTPGFSKVFVKAAGSQVRILAVVDDFKAEAGATFQGYPIITSQAFRELAATPGLVAVSGCRTDRSRRHFKRLAQDCGVPLLNYEQSVRWLAMDCADYRNADWGGYIAENLEPLLALGERLVDDYSRVTLYSVLLAHLTCDMEWILNVCKPYPTLYFRSGLWAPGRAERFVDCGASIAESTQAFLDASEGDFEKIWMIEPDELNQALLERFIDNFESSPPRAGRGTIELLKCALSSVDGEMPFLHVGGHAGHLLSTPTGQAICRSVPLRTLDGMLEQPPTLIKMDIEGAELEALEGARRHILAGRPKLAISAYHRQSDLLDISGFILGLHDDYKVGLRHHTEERWDTCLYFY